MTKKNLVINTNKNLEKSSSVFEQVYKIVLQIPLGKVATYGQISRLLGERLSAAGVGWAMKATPNDSRKIPWHRVVNSRGGISTEKILNFAPSLQQHLLESEGIIFNQQGFIDLKAFQWQPNIKQQES
jgi:methylated-DNA-protein-cysteine methyltransferase related protein